MKKQNLYRIDLTNEFNNFTLTTFVWARNEDTAMDIALRRYKGQELEVRNVEVAE